MARKRPLRKRLRALTQQERAGRRELGMQVVEMYRQDRFSEEDLRGGARRLADLEQELAAVRTALGEAPTDAPEPPESHEDHPPAPEPPGSEERAAAPEQSGSPDPDLDALTAQVDDAEKRVRAAAEGARLEAEERASAEILALEQDLEREQQRAAKALDSLRAQLADSEQRASRAQEERRRGEAEARAAAAEWLRGQAEAMRREAERQVREELAAQAPPPVDHDLARRLEEAERALAEMTERSNEANARAQRAEAAAAERFAAEIEAREEELRQERAAKAEALQAAEQRLAEIERHALAASERVDRAERQLAQETERARGEAEERIRNAERRLEAMTARAEAAERRAEALSAQLDRSKQAPRTSVEAPGAGAPRVSINTAGFDQLRQAGMSVTQANRVIAYRERLGGYENIDDLDQIPGFPPAFLAELKTRLDI